MTSVTEHWRAGLLLKVNDTRETRWFYFATVVQGEGWLGPKLQSAKRDTSKPNRSGQCGDIRSLLKDERKHQEADKVSEHTQDERSVRPLYTPVATGAAGPCPTALLWSYMSGFLDREKKWPFGWLELFFFFSSSTTLALYGLAQRLSPTRWTSGADPSILGQGRQVLSSAWPAIPASKGYLTLNFHGELLERTGNVVIEHRVRTQWYITLIEQKASRLPL